ncbi:AzlD domain-containing protein [Marinobacter sp. M3C]|jgi:branched-subunit amino acid transport protein AzlD|uniref:branched-chain amino acid transporter permease n=1 Tax=unclassified Marinobacter TaxID=83889 RepID=UPI00200CECCD|nr:MULTISPECIES: AzlD domain-containing protein [unclassified Marinobacter]MCL1484443.1 AzlD domain-containing protein [Marinobacter sp.]UQG57919.1 AzlD domain-containing protein [Marinobacter sp. M4C]UQG60811.1 AzlD domain-containing protein [Marinobacter sp. M3C]UQG66724.1 AzlD domain-containing protein [Marinobacter sp. M2C]UQG71004.1 AzlD domain-containing protein [Marinobacter sp. M1C]
MAENLFQNYYLSSFIAVTVLATFATRIIPFVFFERHTEHPLIKHLGRYLPAAVMALLAIIFLQRSATWSVPVVGLDALIPGVLVALVHLWRRNALLSIAAGTLPYMAIQQAGLF